ncbi:hypothetical protein C4E04_18075 [Microvirga sp. 17 mud 1-3]|nr:hypothetical protein C4E04_18075 [Microvirga sp. 17 mud 1-3]
MRAYKTPIDAAADANGAKASLKRRAEANRSKPEVEVVFKGTILGWAAAKANLQIAVDKEKR